MKAFIALLSFLAGILVPAHPLLSQTFPVKGRIVDQHTRAAIPYASVRVKHKTIGVISNADGEFELFIPDAYRRDTLLVSCLGYAQAIPAVQTGSQLRILLEPVAYALKEVVVGQKELSGLEIIRRAKRRIPDNYPSAPYSLEGYYRKGQKVNGKYTYFVDAALRIYDKGYQYAPLSQFALQEKVVLEQTRMSKYHNPKGFENFADLGFPSVIHLPPC